tara:strand:- start:742 stop:1443 length:702 start_codon:yes stop_codon:yes gene_type:complete
MAKRKLFEEAMKAAEKALKIKDPDKRNYAMNQAAKKAVQGDPKAFRGKMVAGKAKKAKLTRPQKSGTKAERAERAAELRELREQRPDNIKELRFRAGGAVEAIKKLLSKKRKAGKKETNPYKSTVGDSYATRSKKQGEIEQKILQNTSGRSSKKQKEMLKTLSERMKKERKETFDKRGMKAGGALKAPTNPGLKKLPTKVRNKMGYMKSGGKVTSKCKRDGIAIRGRTKGRMV